MVIIVILIILLLALITALGKTFGNPNKSMGEYFLESFIVVLIIIICVILGMKFIYGVDISTHMKSKKGGEELDIVFNKTSENKGPSPNNEVNNDDEMVPEIKLSKQVFNVPDNIYTYTDAVALCKAYGGKLANYKQIENAYRSGGEWCSYGWSKGQMALFPTQKQTWDELQTIPGHEHDCGRPGVNGGYIGNPDAQFGVNCYGYKPEITDKEKRLLERGFVPPMTPEDKMINKKENEFKHKLSTILVSPFNYNTWSHLF